MLRNQAVVISALFAIACVFVTPGAAQEAQTDQQKAMEAYMKLGAANENHAFLKNFEGVWDVTTTAWMQPGAPPAVSASSCTADLVLGGRYIMMDFKGFMFGQPFEGIQITGYDNAQKKYITFWIDNTSTAFYLMTGTRALDGKTIDDTGVWPDPMTGGTSRVHGVTKLIGPDEYTYELFMVGADGKEFKSMENRAIRRK
jgi:hypothetical protein